MATYNTLTGVTSATPVFSAGFNVNSNGNLTIGCTAANSATVAGLTVCNTTTTNGIANTGNITTTTLNTTGNASIAGVLTAGSLSVTGNAGVGGNLGITGSTTIGGALGVAGISYTSGIVNTGATSTTTLAVTGASTTNGITNTGNVSTTTLGVTGQTSTNSVGNTTYGYGTTASTASALKQAGSSLSAGNNLSLQSGNDTHITSANLSAGSNLDVAATGNLTIDAVKDSSQLDYAYKAKNKRDIIKNLDETVVASNLNAGKHINLTATQAASQSVTPTTGGKLTLNSANINSQTGAVALNAAQDVTIGSTVETHDHYAEHYTKTKSLLSRKSSLTIDQSKETLAIGSSISGDTVTLNAGKDINVQGSNVVASQDTNLNAGADIKIESAQNTLNETHFKETKQSGLMSSGGIGFTVGKRQLTTTNDTQSVTNTASTVGSVQGNTNITAGKAYTQTGSDVLAPQGDINITAQQVNIAAAQITSTNTQTTKFKQSGLTLSLSSPIISAAQTLQQMASAASHTKDGRMQALAAGTAALAVSNAKDAVMASQADQYGNVATAGNTGKDDVEHVAQGNAVDAAGGINVSISLGSSNSSSSSTQTSSTAQSSHVTACKAIHISATGQQSAAGVQDPGTANPDSGNINVIGSQIKAGNSVTLDAHNQINLIAAQNTATLNSTNKSSSGSIGIGFSLGGASNGFTINAGVSGSKGKTNGNDVSYTDSVIQAGNKAGDKVTLNSGTDTNIIGSQVIGNQVVANVGTAGKGKLNIQSLQDSSTYTDKQSNFGVSVSLCIPPICYGSSSGSVSAGKANTNSHYQSVQQQAGIFAGNGGFQVNVNGNTNLTGAVMASTEIFH